MGRKPRSHRNGRAPNGASATNPDAMKTKNQRNGWALSGASATEPGANKCMAPTPGLDNVKFTWGSARDGATFTETVEKLARYVGTQSQSQSTAATKVAVELVELMFLESVRPTRKSYVVTLIG